LALATAARLLANSDPSPHLVACIVECLPDVARLTFVLVWF